MRTQTRYAVVTAAGEWLTLDSSAIAAFLTVKFQHPAAHVERWTYPVDDAGTFGPPAKETVTTEQIFNIGLDVFGTAR